MLTSITLFISGLLCLYSTKGETQGRYIINNDSKLKGSFTFDCIEALSSELAVGGRYDNTRFLKDKVG